MAPPALISALLALMSAEKLQQTLEAAFHSGTLMHKNNGIVCSCAPPPGKKYPQRAGARELCGSAAWSPLDRESSCAG